MAHQKSTILIKSYLKEQGFEDLVNDILIEEYEANERIGKKFKEEQKNKGMYTEKGRLAPAYSGYHAYFNRKMTMLKNLAITISDRNKLKNKPVEDAVQMELDCFMRKVV